MTAGGEGRYRCGAWYVLLTPTAAVMVDDGLSAQELRRLWAVVRAGNDLDAVVAELDRGGPDRAYGVAVTGPAGLRTAVRAGVALIVDPGDGGAPLVDTGSTAGTAPRAASGTVRLVRIGCDGGDGEVPLPLACGVVRADDVEWTPQGRAAGATRPCTSAPSPRRSAGTRPVAVTPGRGHAAGRGAPAAPSRPAPAAPASGSTPAAGQTLVPLWTGDVRQRPAPAARAAELVQAILCSGEHPNPVQAPSCRTCGEALVHARPRLVPRPPLGRLRFSTGQEVLLDRTVVVGRAPRAERVPGGEVPRPVRIEGRGLDISRTHLEVRLEGWHVLVVDLGSRNGTLVTLPGAQPQLLEARVPCLVPSGTVVELTEAVTFTYQAGP